MLETDPYIDGTERRARTLHSHVNGALEGGYGVAHGQGHAGETWDHSLTRAIGHLRRHPFAKQDGR